MDTIVTRIIRNNNVYLTMLIIYILYVSMATEPGKSRLKSFLYKKYKFQSALSNLGPYPTHQRFTLLLSIPSQLYLEMFVTLSVKLFIHSSPLPLDPILGAILPMHCMSSSRV